MEMGFPLSMDHQKRRKENRVKRKDVFILINLTNLLSNGPLSKRQKKL